MASFKNPALVVTADHKISIEDAPIHEPGPSDVLIHVRATGICGSDIHFWKHGRIGDLVFDGDCILGHEGAGMVVKTGANVKHLQIGTGPQPPLLTSPQSLTDLYLLAVV